MRLRLTVVGPRTVGIDVVVDAETGATWHEARGELLAAAGLPPQASVYVDGVPLTGSTVLGRPPLVEGAVLSARPSEVDGGRPPGHTAAPGFLELHVACGPDAGAIHRLRPGRHRIGRSPHVELRLRDADVSRLHAHLDVGPGGASITDADSTNGTWVDGVRVTREPCPLPLGALVVVGSSTLVLRLPDRVAASVTVRNDGRMDVNRPPRHVLLREPRELMLPAPPEEPEPASLPVLAMVLPLLVSVPMALLWSPFALLLGLSAPVMLLAGVLTERRSTRRGHRTAVAAHRRAAAELEAEVSAEVAAETLHRRDAAPDAAMLLAIAGTPTTRLWERRLVDDDALALRVAAADMPASSVRLRPAVASQQPATPPLARGVPVTVPLGRVGVLGVSGPRAAALGLVRLLVAQVCVLHSPRDVGLAVLSAGGDDPGPEWSWVSWLPHAGTHEAGEPSSDRDDGVRRQLSRLVGLLDRRQEQSRAGAPQATPRVVVVLDGARRLRGRPEVALLLRDGPAHGIHLLCLDPEPEDLPAECAVTVRLVGETGSRVTVRGLAGVDEADLVADLVSAGWAERVARALAPLRDATPEDQGAGVPDLARLLDLLPGQLDLGSLEPAAIAARWRSAPRRTRAVLGRTADGVYAPDLCHDGPHVLVAGTTGSGKSELLQTMIASLAVANRPEELSFVLVDYKGGAAFAECARLPHTVGLVTDLDGYLTRRALASLTAEIRRRERLLAAGGARDLQQYQALLDAGRVEAAIPRLVVVVDEFRVLAEEHPDFVAGLVRLAAVGRSLGVHLVLATQRPGGVVGPDIKANVNLRIALRVRDQMDSMDVIDATDAAAIDPGLPGRALSRGASAALVEFQTARVAGRSAPARRAGVTVRRAGRADAAVRREGSGPRPDEPNSDLEELVRAVGAAVELVGAGRQPSPWLPPLPEVVSLDAVLAGGPDDAAASPTALTLGIVDDPEHMAQHAWRRDPAADGALLVVGTARSGRTTLLRALAAAASRCSPSSLHVYGLDGAGGGLAFLRGLPHTGAVVPRGDPERMARLVRRLAAEVAERRARTMQAVGDVRRAGIMLLVDGWEAVHRELEEVEHGAALDDLLQIVREGPAVGVMAVIAGDRALLTGRLAAAVPDRLVLRTADVTDALLAGASAQDVPERMPPGRGVLIAAERVRQVQVAQVDAIRPVPCGAVEAALLPWRVDPLPERLTRADLDALDAGPRGHPPTWVRVGAGGDDVRPVGIDLADHRVAVVAGPPGSGRSTALRVIAEELRDNGLRALIVRPRGGSAVAEHAAVFGPDDVADLERAVQAAGPRSPAALLVDDAPAADGTPLEAAVLAALDRAPSTVVGIVLAGEAAELGSRFRGLAVEARRARAGVLLSPTGYADGDIFGVSVPRAARVHPGRGYLVRDGVSIPLQVAGAGGMLSR